MYNRTIRTRQRKWSCSGMVASAFLLLYVISNISFETIHAFQHDDVQEAISHTAVDESDPCHRYLYHHDIEKGCHHKSHVESTKHCPLCQLQGTHEFDLIKDELTIPALSPTDYISQSEFAFTREIDILLPARAPPHI